MPQFTYKAKKGPKEVVEGVLEAENRHAAITRLATMDLYPLRVEEQSQDQQGTKSFSLAMGMPQKIGANDIAIFERQLSDLLESGLPLLRSLEVLREQAEQKKMSFILSGLIEEVKSGTPLSQAMRKYPKVFPAMTTSMVRAGEIGGILDAVLARMADFAEKEQETKAKIRAAMAYPVFLCLMGIVTVVVLMLFVIPKMMPVFEDMGQALPLPTRILLGISNICRGYWWVILGILVLGVTVFRRRLKTPEGRQAFDETLLKAPLIGPLIKKAEIARFSRTLAALIANGVPLLAALKISTESAGNVVLEIELKKIAEEISRGQQLGESMKKSPLFPPLVVNMIHAGEQGGLLERALEKVADSYEKEVDRAVKFMTSLLEPAMILLMGSIVGFIVMAMLLPIFSINLAAQ